MSSALALSLQSLRPRLSASPAVRPIPSSDQGWNWLFLRHPLRMLKETATPTPREDRAGPNPHLAEAMAMARRFEGSKRQEMARFIFDNISYFDFWQERGSAERLQLSLLALDGRTISKRLEAEPEAVYIVRLWAADKLAVGRGEAAAERHEENEALVRRFVVRTLPRAEIDRIRACDWAV